MESHQHTYISLFSSAGVGCYGLKLNGFKCLATNEFIERRLKVQIANKKCDSQEGYILGDILDPAIKNSILSQVEKHREVHGDVDFLIATPPCQGISLANHKKTKSDKKRNSLVVESIILTDKIRPIVFIYENVRGFLNTICSDLDGYDKLISEAIEENLCDNYIIESRIVNFKNYGVPSSRTRTLVIGIRKDSINLHPALLFPYKRKETTLKEAIGHLPSLNDMGEFWSKDFLHNYKPFDLKMLPWIENLKEGQSAFDNIEMHRIPHSYNNGELRKNVHKNADKYSRQRWDVVGPCVHTRNDTFSSQNTIHPTDNRVFSIRELMIMMSIPTEFEWFDIPYKALKKLSNDEKKILLKKNETNIRQCLGEAVPTKVFKDISERYLELLKLFGEKKYCVEDIDNYNKTLSDILDKVEDAIINIKLVNPDLLTILLIYNAASLFIHQKINIEVISKPGTSKLDMPDNFHYKNGIKKGGHVSIVWTDSIECDVNDLIRNLEEFERRIIITPTGMNTQLTEKIPIERTDSILGLGISIHFLRKISQFKLF